MWVIFNINLKKVNFFEQELLKKLGSEYKIYYPKIKIKVFKNKKLTTKIIPLLGNYVFCFHQEFKSKIFMQSIKYVKGLNYILNDYKLEQQEIEKFINSCKSNEDSNGFLLQNFLDISLNQFYKFKSGILTNKIFKLINLQKNKITVLINNLKFEVDKKNLVIYPNN